jgi:hypothetical protein
MTIRLQRIEAGLCPREGQPDDRVVQVMPLTRTVETGRYLAGVENARFILG